MRSANKQYISFQYVADLESWDFYLFYISGANILSNNFEEVNSTSVWTNV